jgi:hypothetical protein
MMSKKIIWRLFTNSCYNIFVMIEIKVNRDEVESFFNKKRKFN